MSKSKWWKNKETGEVVLQTGSNRQNMGTVFYRVRSGETFSETKSKFFSSHTQIEASGFPSTKPKAEFNPHARYHGHGFEYYPTLGGNMFMVAGPGENPGDPQHPVCAPVVQALWELGMIVAAEPRPAFDITKTYEYVLDGYYLAPNSHGDAFGIYRSTDHEYLATWGIDAVRKEYDLGMLRVRSKPPEKPKKKVLVEWAVSLGAEGPYVYELYPDGKNVSLLSSFKTGRTVEVPE